MNRTPLLLISATVLILSCVAATARAQQNAIAADAAAIGQPQSWALLIGVNAYAEMRPLKYCIFDMKAVRDKLVDSGFPPENVFLLIDTAEELKYKPTNGDGRVSLLELYHFAEAKTRAHVLRAHNAAQVPSLRGEIASDPAIALVPRRVSRRVEEAEPAASPAPANSDNPAVLSLLKLGNNFFATGQYDEAIRAYSNAINLEPRNLSLYVKRGAAYRGKGDIKMAVIDYQAAGQPLSLNVTQPSALLRDGDRTTATLRQGQSLSITKLEHLGETDWLWVALVDGNDAARGWIEMGAVEPKPALAENQPVAPAVADSAARGQDSYSRGIARDDDRESKNPAMRAAEKKLDTLNNRYDRRPNPVLDKQIDLQERRMDRMDRSRR